MSYIRYRPLQHALRTDIESGLFAWPVQAIPIRYWASSPNSLDILETTSLRLIRAGVHDVDSIGLTLGIPTRMIDMVTRTLNSLRSRGFLNAEMQLTDDGLQVLLDDRARILTYSQGWVLFDQIRGGVFPLVHSGKLQFFRRENLGGHLPVEIERLYQLPSHDELRWQCEAAVEAHNRRLPLIEVLEQDNADLESEMELDRDLLVSASMEPSEVEDVEILPLGLVQRHHLLVEVTAEMIPGQLAPTMHSYSPFSLWEQDRYLKGLSGLQSEIVISALTDLRERARRNDLGWKDTSEDTGALWSGLEDKIKRELGVRIGLSDTAIDKLHYCEYLDEESHNAAVKGLPFRREVLIRSWTDLYEDSLREVACEIDERKLPLSWCEARTRSNDAAWARYSDMVTESGRGRSWLKLPDLLKRKFLRILTSSLPTTFGELHTSGMRDHLVKLMLASLAFADSSLPPRVRNIAKTIDSGGFPFEEFDKVADHRNDVSHGGRNINTYSDEEYLGITQNIRDATYRLLRLLFRV